MQPLGFADLFSLQIQEKKRVNKQKAAAARKAAAEVAPFGSITASSAEQPGQVSNTRILHLVQDTALLIIVVFIS